MTTAQLIQETYIHYDKNGEKTTRYRKGYPKQHENKKVKKAFLKNYQKIQFHDPDEQTHTETIIYSSCGSMKSYTLETKNHLRTPTTQTYKYTQQKQTRV